MDIVKYNVVDDGGRVRLIRGEDGSYTGLMEKEVGDTVACLKGCRLEEGQDVTREMQTAPTYVTGICKSLDPFVIESRDGKHQWHGKNPNHYFRVADIHKDWDNKR
jgi:hypothetical protein